MFRIVFILKYLSRQLFYSISMKNYFKCIKKKNRYSRKFKKYIRKDLNNQYFKPFNLDNEFIVNLNKSVLKLNKIKLNKPLFISDIKILSKRYSYFFHNIMSFLKKKYPFKYKKYKKKYIKYLKYKKYSLLKQLYFFYKLIPDININKENINNIFYKDFFHICLCDLTNFPNNNNFNNNIFNDFQRY